MRRGSKRKLSQETAKTNEEKEEKPTRDKGDKTEKTETRQPKQANQTGKSAGHPCLALGSRVLMLNQKLFRD